MNRLVTGVLVVTLVAMAGCGDGNNNNGTNNTTSNNTTPNNTTSNNTTSNNTTSNNTTPNNTTPNNTTSNNTTSTNNTNPRETPYIARFRYYEEKQSALGPTTEGFTVGVLGGTIENEDGNLETLPPADLEAFETMHLGADTIDRMRNGWDCPEVGSGDMGAGAADMGGLIEESTFWFEARITEADGSDRAIQEITGCVQADDPETGAIIDALTELGMQYL